MRVKSLPVVLLALKLTPMARCAPLRENFGVCLMYRNPGVFD
ncbi:hypothetical protein MC7420_452 [Coleofasciculus chthonoplastes PCC 7420]|uniref:Uncharacterized protein n=1 Tax=Coleofasciculus chthonoplastes PCC 7420 TaxID=118168 RepID=B4VLD8_9CYAN|nr:hypothetical protein MC7420_452 [Coleofasciculus chthonoplastes PCC 7420]